MDNKNSTRARPQPLEKRKNAAYVEGRCQAGGGGEEEWNSNRQIETQTFEYFKEARECLEQIKLKKIVIKF